MGTEAKTKSGTVKERVLVTGAGGTVGGYVVEELCRLGHPVIAVDRPGVEVTVPAGGHVEVRDGDLTDLGFCVDVVKGADRVIHLAATINLRLPEAQIRRINVDAVRYLYEASRAAHVKRFVFFSSGSIYQRTDGPIDESVPFAPSSPYEQSKVDAERYLWSRDRDGLEVTILRPSLVYGPRARFLGAKFSAIPPLLALLFSEIPVLTGGPGLNWIHAEDLARAACHVMGHPDAAWEVYNVADETLTPVGEALEIIARAYGLPVGRRISFPRRSVWLAAALLRDREAVLGAVTLALRAAWRFVCDWHGLEPEIDVSLDREVFEYASGDTHFDASKLAATGFKVRYASFADGYPEVLRWFQENRWAPSYDGVSREWGSGLGFRFSETMAGSWRPKARGGERVPFRFDVTATAKNGRQFARDGFLGLSGRLHAEGLADDVVCEGTLEMSWRRKRELAYELRFRGDDGRDYRFIGRKDVKVLRIVETMTTLPGRIERPDGEVVGEVLARFDLRKDLLKLAGSFDLVAGPAPLALVEG